MGRFLPLSPSLSKELWSTPTYGRTPNLTAQSVTRLESIRVRIGLPQPVSTTWVTLGNRNKLIQDGPIQDLRHGALPISCVSTVWSSEIACADFLYHTVFHAIVLFMRVDIQKKEIPVERLKELQVGLLYLFGSQAEGVAGASSDIDVGIVFTDPKIIQGNTIEIYGNLFDLFTEIFDMRDFRTIDIVFLERASLELRFDAISHGMVLFEVSSDFRLDFEERVSALYRDFKPVLDGFNHAVLERI